MQWLPKKEARNHGSLSPLSSPPSSPSHVNSPSMQWQTVGTRQAPAFAVYPKIITTKLPESTHTTHTHVFGAHTRKCILYDQHLN